MNTRDGTAEPARRHSDNLNSERQTDRERPFANLCPYKKQSRCASVQRQRQASGADHSIRSVAGERRDHPHGSYPPRRFGSPAARSRAAALADAAGGSSSTRDGALLSKGELAPHLPRMNCRAQRHGLSVAPPEAHPPSLLRAPGPATWRLLDYG